jgi:hypothetical protein
MVYLARERPDLLAKDAELDDLDPHAKLDQLLTLSGALQGQSYGLFDCGNPDNTTGSAEERAADAAFYDDGFFDTVGDLVDWLLKFLIVTIIVVAAAVAVAAAAAGPAGGALAAYGLAVMTGTTTALAFNLIRIPETENHLLMINSSKLLKNQLIIEELGNEDDKQIFRGYNKRLREWLLEDLQRIARDDFTEYNSKPYSRLSIHAILNLHDFAEGPGAQDLRTATAAVLDLAVAKQGLSSSQGRRLAPFRRLAGANTPYVDTVPPAQLMDAVPPADHLVSALLVWGGATQHLAPGHLATMTVAGQTIYEATSAYLPPPLLLDIALDKSRPYEQWIRHAGREHYASGPGWLLSAGGINTGFAQPALIAPFALPVEPPQGGIVPGFKDENRGAGVPMTLMIASASPPRQDTYSDLIAFHGRRSLWKKDDDKDLQPLSFEGNMCLRGGFACGTEMQIPARAAACLFRPVNVPANLSFIDTKRCEPFTESPRVLLVLYRQTCVAPAGCGTWGFLEVVHREDGVTLESFAEQTIARNSGRLAAWQASAGGKTVAYVSWGQGTVLFDASNDDDAKTGILMLDGGPDPRGDVSNWGRAEGEILRSTGKVRFVIGRPLDPRRIEIDLEDAYAPKRTLIP